MSARYGDNTKALNSKKIETLPEKANRTVKFLPNNSPVCKEMHKLRILKLKDFLQNILLYMTVLRKKE